MLTSDVLNREELIYTFAEQNRLRTSRETDGTTVIRGQVGCHLYRYSDSELGLMILSEGENTRTRRWSGIRKKCLAAGMILRQNGEDEGAMSFNPNDRQQSRLAIKISGARPKRQLSPEHKAKLVAIGFKKRVKPTLEGVSSAEKPVPTVEVG
jgi:hypothetical protein